MGVSCWAPGRCLTLARSGAAFELESGRWHRRPSVHHRLDYLSLSCGAARLCMAATDDDRAYRWDGRHWRTHAFRAPTGATYTGSVACAGPAFCAWADADGGVAVWRHRWGKTRSRPAFRNFSTPPFIACPAAGRCLAAQDGGTSRPAAAVLRHGGWHAVQGYPGTYSPTPEVSCATPTFCMAVNRDSAPRAFDGTGWSRVPTSPAFGYPAGDVSCPTTSFCASVSAGQDQAFLWRDHVWSGVDPDVMPFQDDWAVDCATATWCLYVGYSDDDVSAARLFDGTGFTEAPVPNLHTGSDVSCPATDDCWAATGGTMVTHFDGTSWTDPVRVIRGLSFGGGVSCPTTDFCVAWTPAGLVSVYRSGAWSDPVDLGALTTLTCSSPTSCTGVRGAPDQASVVRFDGSSWSTTRVLPRGYAVPVISREYSVAAQRLSCPTDQDCVLVDQAGNAYRRTP